MMALKRQKESNEPMFVDQLPFIVAIMAFAINLLHLTLPKGPSRGFYYYAVKPFFINAPGSQQTFSSRISNVEGHKKTTGIG
jgi:hypothetical protein